MQINENNVRHERIFVTAAVWRRASGRCRCKQSPADNTKLSLRLNKFSSGDAAAYLFGHMWARALGPLN